MLVALIIASWTMNVALGLALYLRSTYPAGGYWRTVGTVMREPGKPMMPMLHHKKWKRNFHEQMAPMQQERRRLIGALAEVFTAEKIDSLRLMLLADSLVEVRGRMQKRLITNLVGLHGDLSPGERRDLFAQTMRRMEGGPGRGDNRGMRRHHRIQSEE